jgi:hypothetical protein
MKITFRFHKDFQRTALMTNFSSSGNYKNTLEIKRTMNIRHLINVFLALLVGCILGSYVDRYYLFGPHRAALDVAHFSSRLMENAAMLRDLKSNNIICVKRTLMETITSDLENLEFYRTYPGVDAQTLEHLKTAVNFSREVLRTNEQRQVATVKPCTENSVQQ